MKHDKLRELMASTAVIIFGSAIGAGIAMIVMYTVTGLFTVVDSLIR